MTKTFSRVFSSAVVLALVLSAFPAQFASAATPTELFFSEYIEGSSNNKALEIYNGTGAAINLATGGYSILMSFNGGTSTFTINLTGTVAAGDAYVVAPTNANATILGQADQTAGTAWFNGDDAVVLRKGASVIDVFGQVGVDPGTQWPGGGENDTLRRMDTVCAGDTNSGDAFDASAEWEIFAQDTFGGLGSHTANCPAEDAAPGVTSTYPVDGAIDFPIGANLSVTFSEPVSLTGAWFDLTCSTSGTVSASVAGGPASFTLDPSVNLVDGESCTLTIYAANVTDQDANDPPDNMVLDFVVGFAPYDVCIQLYTPIYDIQGGGATAAILGTVTTQGVVVGDYEGASPTLRGFYLQDATGDGNTATSDGIFVFNGNNNNVNLGDVVRVTGTASEFQGQTQISAVSIINCGTGSVSPVGVTLPFSAVDDPERYEGMLVRLSQTLYVTEHFQLGRFGMVVVSSGGRLQQPTNLYPPGPDADDLQDQNNRNRIIIDDALQNQNPDPILFGRAGNPLSASNTLRGGDTATGTVGVMTYTWAGNAASGNAYRVRPINALGGYINFDASNPRPASVPEVGGDVKVVGLNLLNFFNTFDGLPDTVDNCTFGVGGAAADCRGADTAAEFARQYPKTVAAILAMNADVIGVNEIENDGYGLDSALQTLVDQLNTASAPGTYAFIDVDANTGQVNAMGTDAIKVGLLYRPGVVTPVGQTAALNTVAFVTGGDCAPRSRPSLALAF
jgi:predicted extracellular nuclease